MTYLSAAASNAASIETLALNAGQKGGGAAKGELVLAIFELANSFRHGWGVKKDPVAAKQVRMSRLFKRSRIDYKADNQSTTKRRPIWEIRVSAMDEAMKSTII
jgi:hypothetical protein